MIIEVQYKQQLIGIVHTYVPHCRIWLFGSRARKTNKPGADIDIAIDAGHVLAMSEILRIKGAISQSNIPVFVDVVDVHNVSQDFLDSIKKEWIVWVP